MRASGRGVRRIRQVLLLSKVRMGVEWLEPPERVVGLRKTRNDTFHGPIPTLPDVLLDGRIGYGIHDRQRSTDIGDGSAREIPHEAREHLAHLLPSRRIGSSIWITRDIDALLK